MRWDRRGQSLVESSQTALKVLPCLPCPFVLPGLRRNSSSEISLYSAPTRWARDFGDIFYYRAGWIDVYFLNHPDLIESVLASQSQHFTKDKVIQNSRWFLGQGLLTSEGSEWRRQRRLCQPAFHRERLSSYGQTMGAYTEEMLTTWSEGESR